MEHDTTIRLPNGFETPAKVTYEYAQGGAVLSTRITPETPLRAGETIQGEPDEIADLEVPGDRSVAYMVRAIEDAWKGETGRSDTEESESNGE